MIQLNLMKMKSKIILKLI